MYVDTTIVEDYLNAANSKLDQYLWMYEKPREYVAPGNTDAIRRDINRYYQAARHALDSFEPLNSSVINELFPRWQEAEFFVDLIVGFPAPYDAVTMKDPMGRVHIVIDLYRLTEYGLAPERVEAIVRNLITHEMIHVLVQGIFPEIDKEDVAYVEKLNRITFNEGIAHLLSLNGERLEAIDWDKPEYEEVFRRSKERLKAALHEQNPEKQDKCLEEADTGAFFEKYGAMSGMFYFARSWKQGGTPLLKQTVALGYKDMVHRILLS